MQHHRRCGAGSAKHGAGVLDEGERQAPKGMQDARINVDQDQLGALDLAREPRPYLVSDLLQEFRCRRRFRCARHAGLSTIAVPPVSARAPGA
jgi:hypothetical protein